MAAALLFADYSVCTTWGIRDKRVYLVDEARLRRVLKNYASVIGQECTRFSTPAEAGPHRINVVHFAPQYVEKIAGFVKSTPEEIAEMHRATIVLIEDKASGTQLMRPHLPLKSPFSGRTG